MIIFGLFFFSIFGLAFAFFHTVLLAGLRVNVQPKGLLFILFPLLLDTAFLIKMDWGLTALVISFASVFLMGIVVFIFAHSEEAEEEKNAGKSGAQKTLAPPPTLGEFIFSSVWGILFQFYVVGLILAHIFYPKIGEYDTASGYSALTEAMSLQIYSLLLFTVLSLAILFFSLLWRAKIFLPALFSKAFRKKVKKGRFKETAWSFPADTQRKRILNKLVALLFLLGILFWCFYYSYTHGWIDQFIAFFESHEKFSFLHPVWAIILFIGTNLLLIAIDPVTASKNNIKRLETLLKSAVLGIFFAAALVIPFILLEERLDYFEMSSEILLFLGFNFVLLITEGLLFFKQVKGKYRTH